MMLPRLRRPFGFALAVGLALALLPDPARAQVVVKVNDTVNFRLGFQLQGWAEYLQDPISEGYQQSFYFRRVRLYMAGNIAKNVSFIFDTDQPNSGKSTTTLTKDLSAQLRVNDAFGEWKVFGNDQFILDVGKMLVPITRNSLQSTSSHLALDGGTFTFLQGAGTQSDTARDQLRPKCQRRKFPQLDALCRPTRLQLLRHGEGLRPRRDQPRQEEDPVNRRRL